MALFDDLLNTANKVGGSALGERVLYGKDAAAGIALARAGGGNAPQPAPEPAKSGGFLDFLSNNKMYLWIGVAILGALLVFSVSRRS